MNLKRQLLLVSLLTLLLPWAGCQFIRETESALRDVQQKMLAGTARALASELSQYNDDFPRHDASNDVANQLFLHRLDRAPSLDGYLDDWPISERALSSMRGPDGIVRFVLAAHGNDAYLYVEVPDRNVVYATTRSMALNNGPLHSDRVTLISQSPPYRDDQFIFAAEAPGVLATLRADAYAPEPEVEPAIDAYWQDTVKGYQLEARIPLNLLGSHLGLAVSNTERPEQRATRIQNFTRDQPASAVQQSAELTNIVNQWVSAQDDMRVLITDSAGWRIVSGGTLSNATTDATQGSGWSQHVYDFLVEPGTEAALADPDPQGRERQPYVSAALRGEEQQSWFRSNRSGRAVVATAVPINSGGKTIGVVVLQQSTDAILSLTNSGLARLINLTLLATALVAATLLGYATWLSRRIRRLSGAAAAALDNDSVNIALPSALADDEIGDLSRNFSGVLQQLGEYNDYLQSLASKLSHELRTPLTIVTSSLENLEHEDLSESATQYTHRAREGADRLRSILTAMSEASRVEELMKNAEFESFDLANIVRSASDAYRDIYQQRKIQFSTTLDSAPMLGAPELLIQMLDKLVDNAVDFSDENDTIDIVVAAHDSHLRLAVINPGPPLPENMQSKLFDSLVTVRKTDDSRHLGLGLYIARLIAEGHDGKIYANNVESGVSFNIDFPAQDSR